jgi:hypothetical protein
MGSCVEGPLPVHGPCDHNQGRHDARVRQPVHIEDTFDWGESKQLFHHRVWRQVCYGTDATGVSMACW